MKAILDSIDSLISKCDEINETLNDIDNKFDECESYCISMNKSLDNIDNTISKINAEVAQMVERLTEDQKVIGSLPIFRTKRK